MNISIRAFLENYDNGCYNYQDRAVQCMAGWYDWFCRDYTLEKRLHKMVAVLKKIVKSKKIDIDQQYVFFKNNCPMTGPLYDSFSICDLKTGDVIYWIGFMPKGVYKKDNPARVEVAHVSEWNLDQGFDPTLTFPNVTQAVKWFME